MVNKRNFKIVLMVFVALVFSFITNDGVKAANDIKICKYTFELTQETYIVSIKINTSTKTIMEHDFVNKTAPTVDAGAQWDYDALVNSSGKCTGNKLYYYTYFNTPKRQGEYYFSNVDKNVGTTTAKIDVSFVSEESVSTSNNIKTCTFKGTKTSHKVLVTVDLDNKQILTVKEDEKEILNVDLKYADVYNGTDCNSTATFYVGVCPQGTSTTYFKIFKNQEDVNKCYSQYEIGKATTTNGDLATKPEDTNNSNNANNNTNNTNNNKNDEFEIETVSCGKVTDIPKSLPKLTSVFINLIKIVVPIALVIKSMIDLTKSVMAQKEDEIKKGQSTFIRRMIAAVAVFLIIAISQLVFSIIATSSENSTISQCISCFINNEC